MVCRITLLLF